MEFANTFSQSQLIFLFLKSLIYRGNIFNFDEFQFIHFFPFTDHAFDITSKNNILRPQFFYSEKKFSLRVSGTCAAKRPLSCSLKLNQRVSRALCVYTDAHLQGSSLGRKEGRGSRWKYEVNRLQVQWCFEFRSLFPIYLLQFTFRNF